MNAIDYRDTFQLTDDEAHAMYVETMQRVWQDNSGAMWISVTMEMPEKDEPVICDVVMDGGAEEIMICKLDGNKVLNRKGVVLNGLEAVAWMPLPRLWGE